MDNAQKAIIIGVGLFITILVISIVLLVLNVGMNTTKSTTSKLTTITPELEQQLTTMYVGRTLIKDDCDFVINQYISKLNNNIIYVKNDASGNIIKAVEYDKELIASTKVYKASDKDYYTNNTSGKTISNLGNMGGFTFSQFVFSFREDKTYKCYLLKDDATAKILGLVLLEL